MSFDLKRVLKVMLFASNGPLAAKDIQTAVSRFHEQSVRPAAAKDESGGPVAVLPADALMEGIEPADLPPAPTEDDEYYRDVPVLVTTAEIRGAIEAISLELQAADSEVVLVEGAGGWRLATHPRLARWVRLLRNEPPPVRLSPSSLETLAVIAYRQPATRAEIEQIRGVSAEAGLTKLIERDLVYIVGRADLPGRPLQYGTTESFLEFVGIKSIDELPSSDVLSPRQIDAWLQTASAPQGAGDAEMGLDENEQGRLPLEQPAAAGEPVAAAVTPAP